MKLLIQRVSEASVTVNEQIVSKIGKGLLVLLGIHRDDNDEIVKKLAWKLPKVRLWSQKSKEGLEESKEDYLESKPWSTSAIDNDFEILVVSQFTLNCVLKGNKPDFHLAKKADEAKLLYEYFMVELGKSYKAEKIKGGAFQQMMKVSLVNDGPVTIEIEELYQGSQQPDEQQAHLAVELSQNGESSEQIAQTPQLESRDLRERRVYTYFNQCDSRWGSNIYGINSLRTICQLGDIITSLAMALYTNNVSVFGQPLNPGNFNDWLKQNGGYVGAVYQINSLIPLGYECLGQFKATEAITYFDGGSIVLLQFDSEQWTIMTGYDTKSYFVSDPSNQTQTNFLQSQAIQILVYTKILKK